MVDYAMATIGIAGVFAFAVFGWLFAAFALGNHYSALTSASIAGLIYLVAATVRMLVIEKSWQAAVLIMADIALFALSFAGHLSPWIILACAVSGIWLFFAWRSGRRSIANMVKIRLQDLGRGFVRASLHAVLFLAIASYFSLVNPANLAVPREFIASSFERVMQDGGREIVERIAEKPLSAEEEASVTARAINGTHRAINGLISRIPPTARTGLLIGLGIIVFLLINSVTGLLIPLVTAFVWASIGLLLRLGFISMKTEKVDKETIIA